jgi:hypothetical protein
MSVPMPVAMRDVRRAWWALGLFVVSFVGAFVTGEGLATALGHASDEEVPVGVALAAGLPACAVFALPTLVVWHFGRRAVNAGDRGGRPPVIVAVAVSAAFLAVNLLQLGLRLVF